MITRRSRCQSDCMQVRSSGADASAALSTRATINRGDERVPRLRGTFRRWGAGTLGTLGRAGASVKPLRATAPRMLFMVSS